MKRIFMCGITAAATLFFTAAGAEQKTVRLSIATGGTGGVYYPLGGGMANIISKYIPYAEATAEVTTASVDNCLLVSAGKVDVAFTMADTGWDAYQGRAKFKEKIPLRTLAVLYPNNMHLVSLEGKKIEKIADLKGRRVSTGAPGSGTEVMAIRALEAVGLDPDKQMTRDKLGASESVNALKDGKIDAFFWVGGLPTAAITDLGATPGAKMKLIGHTESLPKMREKYGPLYVKGAIPPKSYPGQDHEIPIAVVWNILVCHENMKDSIAYDILKTVFDHKPELVATHGEAKNLLADSQASGGSPIPFHNGAIRYFAEKGVKVK